MTLTTTQKEILNILISFYRHRRNNCLSYFLIETVFLDGNETNTSTQFQDGLRSLQGLGLTNLGTNDSEHKKDWKIQFLTTPGNFAFIAPDFNLYDYIKYGTWRQKKLLSNTP